MPQMYKSSKVYISNDGYDIIKTNNDSAVVGSDFDIIQYCNEYIKNSISSFTVSSKDAFPGQLFVNFTPITDAIVLNAVGRGIIKFRLQLLMHADSLGVRDRGSKKNYRGFDYDLQPLTSRTDEERWQIAVDYGHTSDWRDPGRRYWFKVKSHNNNTYGRSWLNLTKDQLQSGSAVLKQVDQVLFHKKRNPRCDIYAPQEGYSGFQGSTTTGLAYGDVRYYDYAALLYIPALGPGTSHPFEYHNNGYYRASDNAISIRINKAI